MKTPVFSIGAAVSLIGFLLSLLALPFSFMNLWGGADFFGSFKIATTPFAGSGHASMNWVKWGNRYDVHREYRGVFVLEGRLAIGYLVEDTQIAVDGPLNAPRQGIQWASGVPAVPFSSAIQPSWSVLGVEGVQIRYGNPAALDSGYTNVVRLNIGVLVVATGILPAWWIASRVRSARARRLKGFEVLRARA